MTKAFDAMYRMLTPKHKTITDRHLGAKDPRAIHFGPHAG